MPGSKPTGSRRVVVSEFVTGVRHRGDFMSPSARSALMARIRGKDTGPEILLSNELVRRGLRFDRHVTDLRGRPDFVFRKCQVVVFVDGDFWHGWRLSVWLDKLNAKWAEKITANRQRDRRIHRALRRSGWVVIRIWEHQIDRDLEACVKRVVHAVRMKPRKQLARARSSRKVRDLV